MNSKQDADSERCATKCNGGAKPSATNVARRDNKTVTEPGTNARKREKGKRPRGKHTRMTDFSKSENDLHRDGSTAARLHRKDLSKSVNGTGSNPNADWQRDKSKHDEAVGPLAANVAGKVEERAARSVRDAKGSGPTMQPRRRDSSRNENFAGSRRCNADHEKGRGGKPPRQCGAGGEVGPSATDDGTGGALERFSSAARKVDELIDRGRELELDPGSDRRETERGQRPVG